MGSTIRVWIKKWIRQASGGIEPGDAIARLSADAVRAVKLAAHQNLAVRLQRDSTNDIVCVGIERIGQAGGGIEPRNPVARLPADVREKAARQDLTVRLDRD